ncbi:MAG: lipid A deacylase LpxR family protein [Gemmatimonadaceae bacterium]
MPTRVRRGAMFAAVGMLMGLSGPLVAQSTRWLPRLQLDNDAYNFWISPGKRSDDQYSNGVKVSLESLRAPWWGRRLGRGRPGCAADSTRAGRCLATLVTLGQDIYTPNLTRPPYQSDEWERERPYAAWLYLSGEGRTISVRALRSYTLSLGVTGPPALGQAAQKVAHRIVPFYAAHADGWNTQVGFEPTVLASVRQSVLASRLVAGDGGVFDLVPYVGGSLGNALTGAEAGARARLGVNMSHPWDPRAWRLRPEWEFNVSAGARREVIAHSFSLDGTLVSPKRKVERVPVVDEYEFGAALRLKRLSVGYRAVTRGREYTTGPRHHTYSSMYAGIEFVP